MARYRIGEVAPTSGEAAGDGMMLTGTAVFGLFTGAGFFVTGLRVGVYWLIFWGAGLAIASLAYLIYRYV